MKTLQLTILSISACILVMVIIQSVSAQVAPVLGLPHAFFKSDHAVYPIQYNLTNAILLGTPLDLPAKALLFTFNATGDGQLTVELPRKIIDSTRNGVDKPYFVSLGDVNAPPNRIIVNEIQNNNESRILAIHFTKGEKQVEIVGTYFIENNSTSRIINLWTYLPPLAQFQRGIDSPDVTCKQGFQLILKAEDGSPACVKPDTAIILVEHRWATNVPQPNPMTGLNNDTGIATLGNHTYYFETPNYTETAYVHPTQISFHDVIFTLFPSGFRGGLPAWGCGGGYYWADAKFSDGTSELLQIFVGSKDCFLPQPSTHFSIHTNPQAGLTFYDGKMKLLASVENQTKTNPNLDEFDGVIIDQSLSASHVYSFFTNETSVKFNTGSEGIRLEGIDNINGLDGKHVKIFGEIPIHQEGEDKIKVEKFQILGSFVPKGTPPRNMIQKVSFDDLFNNPDRYYNQTITITGQLREYDNPLGIAGVGCHSAEFTTSDEFVPDFISRHQLYNGDRYIGVRIGGQDDVGYSEYDKLPLDLKNKQVTITGIFVPSIKDTGYCMHILHKSGYVLTDFKKINVVKG